jgi:acyl-coenzyme A synthetase/AMP-(fatty) acid ligase
VPRSFAFVERLPRTATGKLATHRLVRNQPEATGASVEFTAHSAPAPADAVDQPG